MSDTQVTRERRSPEPPPPHPPLHVILSYLLGTWADSHVFGADRTTPKQKEPRL